jgi:microcystin-dependent protein
VIPTGTIIAFAGKITKTPAGWLACEGQELKVASFKELFAALGTLYGGDGVMTFRLPDLRGRVIVGAGQALALSNRALGQKGGEETHVLTIAEMPSHSHVQTVDDPGGTRNGKNQSGVGGDGGNAGIETGSTRPAGGGEPHNAMPPFLVLNFLIKT